jgi:PAS domain S-box-containing protein
LARDVTARRRAAEALADSEEKYRRLVETSHDIIFTVDLEGNFLFANQALENILGYSHDEIKQINGFALLHPEDLENVQEHFARLKQGKRVDNLEYRGRAKDGSYLDLLTNGVPIFDSQGNVGAALCISRDITQLKRSLEAVKESEARFRTVFNAVMDSIFIKDVSGRPFDAVIFDLTVPGGMGGKEAVARLLEVDPEVKAIVSSGYSHDPVLADFRSYGFRGVIEKPYEIERLGEVLCQIIGGEDA